MCPSVASAQPPTDPTPGAGATGGRVAPQVINQRIYHDDVVNKGINNRNYINKKQIIGHCITVTAGGYCTISSSLSATRTVSLAFSATRCNVTSQLGISNAVSQTVSVSCTSPRLAKGQRWVAYPVGVRWQYKIHEWVHETGPNGVDYNVGTSGWLNAFNPSRTSIACGLG